MARKSFATMASLANSHPEITNDEAAIKYLRERGEMLRLTSEEESISSFRAELASIQLNRYEKYNSVVDWKRQSIYSFVKDSFLWIDQKDKLDYLLYSCYLSFFATLFADRQGTILSLDSQSTMAAMMLTMYSGFNYVIPHDGSGHLVQMNALLNAIEHRVLPAATNSLTSLQTFYSVDRDLTLPPFPTHDVTSVSQIENDCHLDVVYRSIDRAKSLLKKSIISEDVKRHVPTEKSLYMICPSIILPYLYNHYASRDTFDHFYCSILTDGSQNERDLKSSKALVRAFFEEEDEEDLDDEEYEAIKEMDDSAEEMMDIDLEEGENMVPRFVSCPSISITDSPDELNEDVEDFINQFPGFGTYKK